VTHAIGRASPTAREFPLTRPSSAPSPRPEDRPSRRRLFHPLVAVLAVQACLSMSLIWSNSAFNDEGDYLWVGRLLLDHWLHGTSWPSSYAQNILSGSPLLYPPLGAMASSLGGLTGARILSLVFMLAATVLLWLVCNRLFGATSATCAAALWAMSEPAIKLGAFATYDAMSVFLMALSAWLAVQACFRRHRGELVAASAIALALSGASAYSGLLMLPAVMIFAFLLWRATMRTGQAVWCAGWFTGVSAVLFAALITIGKSWPGLMYTVIDRKVGGVSATPFHVLHDTWSYSGLVIIVACIGAVIATVATDTRRRTVVIYLAATAFLVPLAQGHDQTIVSLDKHLAYGIWLSAIAAGYACGQLIQLVSVSRRQLALVVCCLVALAYPAIIGYDAAQHDFKSWGNAKEFIAALKPVVAHSNGYIYVPNSQMFVASYYLPEGNDWQRWQASPGLPYPRGLATVNFGTVVIFYYATSVPVPPMTQPALGSRAGSGIPGLLLRSRPVDASLQGLTAALEQDPSYQLAAVGTEVSDTGNLVYAIWHRRPGT
jgi:hypothetical protein